jgi:hypothetical protein
MSKNVVVNFNDCVDVCLPIMMTGHTPLIRGLHGIGKSAIAKELKTKIEEESGMVLELIHINCAYIHEGELGGIPYPIKDEEKGYSINDNTVHYIIDRILTNDKEGIGTLLFLDEVNRCADKSVFNEFMSLINEKKVNMIELPETCFILAAGNPDEMDEDEDVLGMTYLVQKMDPAVKDRMFIIDMKSNPKDWLKWAMENNINEDIVDFLSTYTEFIHDMSNVDDEQHPTPRSWEKFSDVYSYINNGNSNNSKNLIYEIAASKVGKTVALQFVNFIKNKENPLIKATDIFEASSKENLVKTLDKFKNEIPTRKYIELERFIKYMSESTSKGNNKLKEQLTFTIVLNILNPDLLLSIMSEIKDNKSLIKNLIKVDEDFINSNEKLLLDIITKDYLDTIKNNNFKNFEDLLFEFNSRTKLAIISE